MHGCPTLRRDHILNADFLAGLHMSQILRRSVVFESRGKPAATAIEAWHDIADNTLRISIDEDDRDRFSLSLHAMRLDQTVATAAQTTAQSLHRDLDRAHRDGLDQYGFFLQVTGSRLVRANGVDAVLLPGDLQFVDMAQEDRSVATDGRTTTLYVPRDLVESDVPEASRLHGTIIRSAAAQVFANQMLSLFDPTCAWSPVMAGFLERSLLSMAFGCLVELRWTGLGQLATGSTGRCAAESNTTLKKTWPTTVWVRNRSARNSAFRARSFIGFSRFMVA